MISLFFQESTDDLLSKNVLKYDISSIIEKGDIYLGKYVIFSDREILVTDTKTQSLEISKLKNLLEKPRNTLEVTRICDPSKSSTTPSQFQTWVKIKVS